MNVNCVGGCKIGIMGGTFDPIHQGHLVLADQVRENFGLDQIVFIPVGGAPHKDTKGMTSKLDRYSMTVAATASNPYFSVSKIEIDKEGKTYTVDTIKELKKQLNSQDELFFITGADAIMLLETWKDVDQLVKEVNFIAATRPGYDRASLEASIKQFEDNLGANILLTSVPALAISSTDIRNRVANGQTIRYLVPESVNSYIEVRGLYHGE